MILIETAYKSSVLWGFVKDVKYYDEEKESYEPASSFYSIGN